MLPNHEYCRDAVLALVQLPGLDSRSPSDRPARVLDYGCGAAQIVKALRAAGVDAYGADVFYDGGSHFRALEHDELFTSGIVRRMESDRTDFDGNTFDVVFSNQVLEHVPDLDQVLGEMHRILKPGGVVLSLFPDRSVWREGHCGIPFLHRFPKRSRLRMSYALMMRSIGFGYFKEGRTRREWSRNFCEWLDNWTYYRSLTDIHQGFSRHFTDVQHMEDEYLAFRLRRSPLASLAQASQTPVVRPLARYIVRRNMGLVFTATKPLEN